MNEAVIPRDYLNQLPIGALVVKSAPDTLNHKTVFVNRQFEKDLGWLIEDIPDKEAWWLKAYPEEHYRQVVARQWELCIESFDELESDYVSMDVNICSKANQTVRCRVFTELKDSMIPGHYVVMFMKL